MLDIKTIKVTVYLKRFFTVSVRSDLVFTSVLPTVGAILYV